MIKSRKCHITKLNTEKTDLFNNAPSQREIPAKVILSNTSKKGVRE
jgi:hypothetical protein